MTCSLRKRRRIISWSRRPAVVLHQLFCSINTRGQGYTPVPLTLAPPRNVSRNRFLSNNVRERETAANRPPFLSFFPSLFCSYPIVRPDLLNGALMYCSASSCAP